VRNAIDFTSWEGLLSTLLGLALFSLVVVGIRLLVMHTVQLRRERENRQINERLRTLIAAYKTLGGSFTGNLQVDPAHLRDWRAGAREAATSERAKEAAGSSLTGPAITGDAAGSERRRRVRDAVEAALSDVILLGTDEQVRLAARAANDMAAGRHVETAALVVSLRTFIREVLDLDAIPGDVEIPKQGPARPASSGARSGRDERGAGARAGRGGGSGDAGAAAGGAVGFGWGTPSAHDDGQGDPS
jgi:hypothetical protein